MIFQLALPTIYQVLSAILHKNIKRYNIAKYCLMIIFFALFSAVTLQNTLYFVIFKNIFNINIITENLFRILFVCSNIKTI